MYDSAAKLVTTTFNDGEYGLKEATEVKTQIFCSVKSVSRAEYFKAYDSGLLPEFVVITNPINYDGQSVIEVETQSGVVRCDIYRTYRKSLDEMELYCIKKNDNAVQPVTLWTKEKIVHLYGAYITGGDAVSRSDTGKDATGSVSLVLPQSLKAFCGTTAVGLVGVKAYANAEDKTNIFCIDSSCFFAPGLHTETGKYQAINGAIDDVHLVQSVAVRNRGIPDTEYIEVIGR